MSGHTQGSNMGRQYQKRARKVVRRVAVEDKVHDRRSTDLPANSIVAIAIVQDPYKQDDKIEVLRSIRDDPLAGMISRQHIDEAQYNAGRKWQGYYEASEIGGVIAINPTKEAVDGHGPPRPHITDRQMEAFKELKEADKVLGLEGCALVRDVLGRRMSISQAAVARCMTSRYEIEYMGRRFREALESLAILWGYAQPKYRRT